MFACEPDSSVVSGFFMFEKLVVHIRAHKCASFKDVGLKGKKIYYPNRYFVTTLYIKATMVKTRSTIQEGEGESVHDLGNEARNVD